MKKPPVNEEIAESKNGDTSKLVGSESNEFAELLLALSNLVLLYFFLGLVLKPLNYVFFNYQSFLYFIATRFQRLDCAQLVESVCNFHTTF